MKADEIERIIKRLEYLKSIGSCQLYGIQDVDGLIEKYQRKLGEAGSGEE